jgi:predicted O-methyltransferase YrrM
MSGEKVDTVTVGEALNVGLRPAHPPPAITDECEMSRLFALHRASKCTEHGPLYQELLTSITSSGEIAMLEIGVNKGGSLAAFAEFMPHATIYGIDHNERLADRENVFIGDQADSDFLMWVVGRVGALDVVIDDGGHKADQQQISFEHFWPIVKPGGYYVIEDLYVCEKPNFRVEGRKTTLEYIDDLVDQGLQVTFHYCQGFDRDVCVIHKG